MSLVYTAQRANDLDRPTLLTLRRELTNSPSRGDFKDDGGVPGSDLYERLEGQLSGGDRFPHHSWIILARSWGAVAGWCLLVSHESRLKFAGESSDVYGNVSLYVGPVFRRLGVATGLLQRSQYLARKNRMTRLVSHPWNEASHTFFTSQGFVTLADHSPSDWAGYAVKELQ